MRATLVSLKQNANTTKKHRHVHTPFECSHCGLIRYGYSSTPNHAIDARLCLQCGDDLSDYMDGIYSGKRTDPPSSKAPDYAKTWIDDKSSTISSDKHYHKSVPKWMQSAIDKGLVKTNSEEVYTVTVNDLGEAISVEVNQK